MDKQVERSKTKSLEDTIFSFSQSFLTGGTIASVVPQSSFVGNIIFLEGTNDSQSNSITSFGFTNDRVVGLV